MANNEELTLNVEVRNPYVVGPVVNVEPVAGGAKITIIDKNGETSTTILNGVDGVGIASATLNADYTLTLLYTDGTSMTTTSIRGATGDSGVYIGEDEPTNPEINVWIDPTNDDSFPNPPTEDGEYMLKATVNDGSVQYEWVEV